MNDTKSKTFKDTRGKTFKDAIDLKSKTYKEKNNQKSKKDIKFGHSLNSEIISIENAGSFRKKSHVASLKKNNEFSIKTKNSKGTSIPSKVGSERISISDSSSDSSQKN